MPYVGEGYEQGFQGRRLLVLGESHYDEWDTKKHFLDNHFTRHCIEEVVKREHGAPFWRNIEQALLNEPVEQGWAPNGGKPLWEKLAFYNFVQSPVQGTYDVPPKRQQFEESRQPFRAILERLRPERVWVCGARLWEGMEGIPQTDHLHGSIQAYRLADDTQVWCYATHHPSFRYFSWRRWHPLLSAFIDEPRKAVEMMATLS